jgi:hypothetical protein
MRAKTSFQMRKFEGLLCRAKDAIIEQGFLGNSR